jgi:hypothetical protein
MKALGVEEVGRAQVLVALGLLRIDARDLDAPVQELVHLAALDYRDHGYLDRDAAAVDQLLAVSLGHEDQLVVIVTVRLAGGVLADRDPLEQAHIDLGPGVQPVDGEADVIVCHG